MTRHLEYSQLSLYDFLVESSKDRMDWCALEYFGVKITYKKLVDMTKGGKD